MPRLPTDYKKGLIYKIVCNDITIKDCYVGSTTDITRRRCHHKSNCNNPDNDGYNFKVYKFIRENNGWDNWSLILVENFPCENKLELVKRERYWIETLESKLNSRLSQRTDKEWRDDNKEILKKKRTKYKTENKEQILEKERERYAKDSERIKGVVNTYRLNNPEKIKERKKKYAINNADKIKERKQIRVVCECDLEVNKNHIARHRQTQRHINLMIIKNNPQEEKN